MILVLKEHTDTLYCIFLISIILHVISNKDLMAQIASIMLAINIMACIFSNVEHEIDKPLVIIIIIILTTIVCSPLIFIHQISQKLESVSYFQTIYKNTMEEIIINNTLENTDKFKLENPLTQLMQTILTFELMLLISTITLILMNMNIMIMFIIFFILIIIVEIIQYQFDLYSSSEIEEMYIKNLNKTNVINKDTLRVIRIFQKHFFKTILIPLHIIILIIMILIFIIITYILPLSITRESTT
jgi:hypothetical protein